MPLWKWSRTAASNGTADSTCPFPEGMAPSAVNDGVRGAMAALAMYRDDIAGAIVTSGTSTAYAVSSYSGFDTLARLDAQMIAFTPHATNGATVTLNVDSLGARPLRTAPGTELLAGTIIQGTPYVATYNNTDGAFYLRSFYGNPYNVPLAGGMDFWGTTVPNSSFAFPAGQAISRTTYATLFAIMGTTYGSGDGSTTFNLPDKTGRVSAMKEAAATRLTSTYFGGNSTVMGAVGGADHTSNTIAQANLPNVNLASNAQSVTVIASLSSGNITGGVAPYLNALITSGGGGTQSQSYPVGGQTVPLGGSGTPLPVGNVPPAIVCNYIIRII